jgi:hypothetical protein
MPIMNRPKTHSAVRLSRFFLGPDRPLGLAAGTLARPCALHGVSLYDAVIDWRLPLKFSG